jgi:hypothetical protein
VITCPRVLSTPRGARLGALVAAAILLVGSGAAAQDGTGSAKVSRLNKQALEAFDSLNFDQAKSLLEQALVEADAAGLTTDESVARTHLNLGMLLIAGFQQKEQAIDHFKAALKAKPDIAAPPGLFNPEVQTVFDEVKANMKAELEATKPTPPPVVTEGDDGGKAEGEGQDEEEDDASAGGQSTVFLSFGLGSGFGYASSHLDANKDISKMAGGPNDNSWSGPGLSQLGHLIASVGYFISPSLVLSLEGRFQIITGTTSSPVTPRCMTPCKPPGSAFAGLLKATWFLSSNVVRPFVSGGIGGGAIRQVVKVKVLDMPDCGNGSEQCMDTVTGGPLLLAAGGGVAYQLGTVALLGSVTATVGAPNFMLNIDATLGLGLRL